MSKEELDAEGVLAGKRRLFEGLLRNAQRLKEGWFDTIFGLAPSALIAAKKFGVVSGAQGMGGGPDGFLTPVSEMAPGEEESPSDQNIPRWIEKGRSALLFERGAQLAREAPEELTQAEMGGGNPRATAAGPRGPCRIRGRPARRSGPRCGGHDYHAGGGGGAG